MNILLPKQESCLPANSFLRNVTLAISLSKIITKGLGPIQKVNTGPYFLDNSINSTLEYLLVP
jgi:hypothetical protein